MSMMTDPVVAKTELHNKIKDLPHAKCATSTISDAVFDKRVLKNKAAGMSDDDAVHAAYTDLMRQHSEARSWMSRGDA